MNIGENQKSGIFRGGIVALAVAGIGFAARAGLLKTWGSEFGFSNTELGAITGGGLTGFGIVVFFSGFLSEKFGFRLQIRAAVVLHIVSAGLLFLATPLYGEGNKDTVYWILMLSVWLFSIGNGLIEGVINPLTAAMYPEEKTHKLAVVHIGWPLGMLIGGVAYWALGDHVNWVWLGAGFALPTIVYGWMMWNRTFPKTEAGEAGISIGRMMRELLSPLLFILLILHAAIGYVELGTDSWVSNLVEKLSGFPGILVLVYTSTLMTILRCVAKHAEGLCGNNPVALLVASSGAGFVGLFFMSTANGIGSIFLAATVFSLGKAYFWPTSLALVSQQYPRSGALGMNAMGAAGMLTAGIVAGPLFGFFQDTAATAYLENEHPAVRSAFVVEDRQAFGFLSTAALDAKKVAEIKEAVENGLSADFATAKTIEVIEAAETKGGQNALRKASFVALFMAISYALLYLYFKGRGGYRPTSA